MRKTVAFLVLSIALVLCSLLLSGCDGQEKKYYIGVLQWTEEIQPFNKAYQGVIDSLSDKGYREGINLVIHYQNVEQDKNLAVKVAQSFVEKNVDLIVALGTGSCLAALEATRKQKIPIVFSIVGSPEATGIIQDYQNSGKNITGVSMKVPIREQFQIMKEILPDMKKLGILYSTEMPQAIATGEEAASVAKEFGWTHETHSPTKKQLERLPEIMRLLANKVDAVYIPVDPVMTTPGFLQTIVRITGESGIPVIGVAKKFVESGFLAALHCDYYEIGRQAGEPIIKVLNGADVRGIPSQKPLIKKLSVNLIKAKQLKIKIPRNVIMKADNIID